MAANPQLDQDKVLGKNEYPPLYPGYGGGDLGEIPSELAIYMRAGADKVDFFPVDNTVRGEFDIIKKLKFLEEIKKNWSGDPKDLPTNLFKIDISPNDIALREELIDRDKTNQYISWVYRNYSDNDRHPLFKKWFDEHYPEFNKRSEEFIDTVFAYYKRHIEAMSGTASGREAIDYRYEYETNPRLRRIIELISKLGKPQSKDELKKLFVATDDQLYRKDYKRAFNNVLTRQQEKLPRMEPKPMFPNAKWANSKNYWETWKKRTV